MPNKAQRLRMRVLRYMLLVVGCVFLVPVLLDGLAMLGLLPEGSFLQRCLGFFFIMVGDWLLSLRVPSYIANTGGHMPHLTVFGFVLVYVLPAGLCLVGGSFIAKKKVR